MPDFKPAMPRQARDPRMTLLYAGTLAVAVVSGICALVALAAGSPLQFGVTSAVFGAGWIATDFIERTTERGQERFARQCVVAQPVPRLSTLPRRGLRASLAAGSTRREQASRLTIASSWCRR